MTDHLHVIGDPVSHSLSPAIHGLWIRTAGLDAIYTARHVPAGTLSGALMQLEQEGCLGANVTLPHKEEALKACREISHRARQIGAVNTLIRHAEGGWYGDNTDAPGLMSALDLAGARQIRGRTVLIIGAGGAARAAVFALARAGARLVLVNRTMPRAQALSDALAEGCAEIAPLSSLRERTRHCDIVINTASAGHHGQVFPLADGDGRLFMDISYGHAAQAQLLAARQCGWQTQDGLAMLVAQAAISFEIWFGQKPNATSALEHLRQNVEPIL